MTVVILAALAVLVLLTCVPAISEIARARRARRATRPGPRQVRAGGRCLPTKLAGPRGDARPAFFGAERP